MPSKSRLEHILNSTNQRGIPKSKISTDDFALEPRVMLAASATESATESADTKPYENSDATEVSKPVADNSKNAEANSAVAEAPEPTRNAERTETAEPVETASNRQAKEVSRDIETEKSQLTGLPSTTPEFFQGLPIGTFTEPLPSDLDLKSLQKEDQATDDSAREEDSTEKDSLFVSPFTAPAPKDLVVSGQPTAEAAAETHIESNRV